MPAGVSAPDAGSFRKATLWSVPVFAAHLSLGRVAAEWLDSVDFEVWALMEGAAVVPSATRATPLPPVCECLSGVWLVHARLQVIKGGTE